MIAKSLMQSIRIRSFITYSAIGLRQIFPRQINKILVMPGRSPFGLQIVYFYLYYPVYPASPQNTPDAVCNIGIRGVAICGQI